MGFWPILWSVVWFGGLGGFTILTVLITWHGAKDLKVLLSGLEQEKGANKNATSSTP